MTGTASVFDILGFFIVELVGVVGESKEGGGCSWI